MKNSPGKPLNCFLGRDGGGINNGENEEARGNSRLGRFWGGRSTSLVSPVGQKFGFGLEPAERGSLGGTGRPRGPGLKNDGAPAHRSAPLGSQIRDGFFYLLSPQAFR